MLGLWGLAMGRGPRLDCFYNIDIEGGTKKALRDTIRGRGPNPRSVLIGGLCICIITPIGSGATGNGPRLPLKECLLVYIRSVNRRFLGTVNRDSTHALGGWPPVAIASFFLAALSVT